ncbi:MAG TPA: hypothetical protein VND23_10075 [Acidimicrobiales bacterium]|nr:hypothetical protein [Acidimicrobiales bacterium]
MPHGSALAPDRGPAGAGRACAAPLGHRGEGETTVQLDVGSGRVERHVADAWEREA